MAIVDMKKVFLLAHREEREAVMDLLYRMGTVELVDVKSGSSWNELSSFLQPEQAAEAASSCDNRLGETRYCLDFLQRHFPVNKSFVEQFIGSKLELTGGEYAEYLAKADAVGTIYTACREAEEKLTTLRNEENRCLNLLEELKPWVSFSLPLEEIRSSERVEMGLAVVPEECYPALKESWPEQVADSYLEEIAISQKMACIFYIYLSGDTERVQALFRDSAAVFVSFPELTGSAAEAVAKFEANLIVLSEERAAAIAEVENLAEHRPLLMALYDHLDNERAKHEAASNLARTNSSFIVEGWVPEPYLESLKQALAAGSSTAVLFARDPDKYEEVPVFLQNKGPADACEVVTRLYSVPLREELDPTPFMAPFFIVFFGICTADVGYGAALSLFAFYLTRKLKLAGMGRQLVYLLLWGGASSVVFGVLQGGYFGDLFKIPALWFNPLEGDGLIKMMLICFALGLFQMFFGMGLRAHRSIKAGKPLDALLDQGSWFAMLSGLVMFAIPGLGDVAKWVAGAGAVSLLFTQGRRQKGLLRKLGSGLGSLYGITEYLSGVLSYSRLLALGLSTAVIASVFNILSRLVETPVVSLLFMVAVLLVGHIFNMMIGVISAYVHSSRLQYIEFFGRFFEGGGKAFRPFIFKSKYVDVVEPGPVLTKAETGTAAPLA